MIPQQGLLTVKERRSSLGYAHRFGALSEIGMRPKYEGSRSAKSFTERLPD
jgi:hypothetical protein